MLPPCGNDDARDYRVTGGELSFALHVIGWWPWIVSALYALLFTIFAVPWMLKAPHRSLPFSPILMVVGGAAFLMAVLGTIEAAVEGAFTDQGVFDILSLIMAFLVLGGLVGLAAMVIGALIADLRGRA